MTYRLTTGGHNAGIVTHLRQIAAPPLDTTIRPQSRQPHACEGQRIRIWPCTPAPFAGLKHESEPSRIRESGGLCEVAGARVGRHERRPHISRIERRRGPVGRYGESATTVLVFRALFAPRGARGAVRRRSGGDLAAFSRRGDEAFATETGRKGAAMAGSVSAGDLAAWRRRAIEVAPRLAIMMCRSERWGRPGRCAAWDRRNPGRRRMARGRLGLPAGRASSSGSLGGST